MPEVIEDKEAVPLSDMIKHVPPHLLKSHPINEKIYGEEIVDQNLLDSIRKGGIIEELQVTPEYVIISGHRRRAAAVELGLETVPVRIRYDLETEDQITWALIEANRTQRDKTFEQKIREVFEINDRLKKFRAEVEYRYGVNNFKEIAAIENINPDEIAVKNPKELQEFIKDNSDKDGKGTSSLEIALKHYGISMLHWKKARKAVIAIEEFETAGRISDAREARHALNTFGLKRFDKVIDRLKGVRTVKRFTKPSELMKKAIEAFSEAIGHLPTDGNHIDRANIALGIMNSTRDELVRMAVSRELSPSTEKVLINAEPTDDD